MVQKGGTKHNRLLVVEEKDILSFCGGKRTMGELIDSDKAFAKSEAPDEWSTELMHKMYQALSKKYSDKQSKYVYTKVQTTAREFLRLALEDERAKKAEFNSLMASQVEEPEPLAAEKPKSSILDFAPTKKSQAAPTTLAVGDWIWWSQKVFKDAFIVAQIVGFSPDAHKPLLLSTGDVVRAHDTVQKCMRRLAHPEETPFPAQCSEERRLLAAKFYGKESLDALVYHIDGEGLLRPKGVASQVLGSYVLLREESTVTPAGCTSPAIAMKQAVATEKPISNPSRTPAKDVPAKRAHSDSESVKSASSEEIQLKAAKRAVDEEEEDDDFLSINLERRGKKGGNKKRR